MTWQTTFPNFPAADMPSIPEGWKDTSWHNDAAPSFEVMTACAGDSNFEMCRVWIAESDPAAREYDESPRFQVSYEGGESEWFCTLETDDWQEVLAYVETRQALAASYVAAIGYNPFLDDPNISPDAVRETLKERA